MPAPAAIGSWAGDCAVTGKEPTLMVRRVAEPCGSKYPNTRYLQKKRNYYAYKVETLDAFLFGYLGPLREGLSGPPQKVPNRLD